MDYILLLNVSVYTMCVNIYNMSVRARVLYKSYTYDIVYIRPPPPPLIAPKERREKTRCDVLHFFTLPNEVFDPVRIIAKKRLSLGTHVHTHSIHFPDIPRLTVYAAACYLHNIHIYTGIILAYIM